MTRRSDDLLASGHDRRPVFGAESVRTGMTTKSFSLLAIGLLLVTGCSQKVAGTPSERAMAHFEMSQWEEAIKACSDAITDNPEDAAAYLLRGRAQQCVGRSDQAVADLTIAIRLDPKDPEAYYQRRRLWSHGATRSQRCRPGNGSFA